jgi:hypothetical protein
MMRRVLQFESRRSPVATRARFLQRLAASIGFGAGIVAFSLAIGIAGYHYLEHLDWLDAFVNAAMILSGMGPLANPQSTGGKLFAGLFALYSGLLVVVIAGIIFAPVFHRFLHKFHVEDEADPINDDVRETSPRTKGPGETGIEFGGARTRTRRQTKPR